MLAPKIDESGGEGREGIRGDPFLVLPWVRYFLSIGGSRELSANIYWGEEEGEGKKREKEKNDPNLVTPEKPCSCFF